MDFICVSLFSQNKIDCINYFYKEKNMNNASSFLIGGNDEHGINPPTIGKRTPIMPYLNRSIYENQFNYPTKNYFLMACLRTGFNTFDVKPERIDVALSTRVARINQQNLSALVTFAYNAAGNDLVFSNANGIEVFYSPQNPNANQSQTLSQNIYDNLLLGTNQTGRGVKALDVSVLSNVRTISSLVEAGFMTNFNEAKLMIDPDFQMEVAEESCQGISKFFNVQYLPPITNARDLPILKKGSRGRSVKYLQYALVQNGYNPQGLDGVFGANTLNAVLSFQKFNNLADDGIVGPNTWTYLLTLNPASKTLKVGDTGSYVLYLQRKLEAKLYPVGQLDGILGSQTANAVKSFQQENNLAIDGIVGPQTWAKLLPIGNGRPFPNQ